MIFDRLAVLASWYYAQQYSSPFKKASIMCDPLQKGNRSVRALLSRDSRAPQLHGIFVSIPDSGMQNVPGICIEMHSGQVQP
jgi:hypothetical protein